MVKFRNILILFCCSITMISCKGKSDDWLFKEVGSMLWVNATMPDTIVKLGVKETLENSSIIIAQVSWSPMDRSFITNVKWYHSLAIESGKSFMLNIDWLKDNRSGTNGNWGFENEKVRILFIKDINRLVELYHPNYLTLGVEVNYYALNSPAGYKEFIKTFNELKTKLKDNNPNIKIGLSFQLELLYGIHTGWEQTKTLEPLDVVVENLDYIGVSTYPDVLIPIVNKRFYSIDYLDSLSITYKRPIGISETGISSIRYKNIDRVKYIQRIYKKAEDLNLRFIVWGSIIDGPVQGDWKSRLGLIDSKGIYKPEFDIWKRENNKIIKN
jgi:hypothetical protein